jgi:hypothetical protein
MSALAMILTAAMVVPGDVPEKVSGEMEQGLDLSGEWEGTITYGGEAKDVVMLDFTLIEFEWSRVYLSNWKVQDEGQGRFRLIEVFRPYIGIYEWRSDCLALCYAKADIGRPTSFQASDGQILLILHRVKPGQ